VVHPGDGESSTRILNGIALLGARPPRVNKLCRVRVAFGTDEMTPLVEVITDHLAKLGHDVEMLCAPARWPQVGRRVGEAVAEGRVEAGVVCCWTGTGVSIAANKVSGVRAALCVDAQTAAGSRKWNDANVLAVSLRLTSPEVAREILDAFMSTEADPSESDAISELH
jgi:ribose 5-phosphate isomerase B